MSKILLVKVLMFLIPVVCVMMFITPLFWFGAFLLVVYILVLKFNQAKIIGLLGEWYTTEVIQKSVEGTVFRDIYIKGSRGVQQIDILAVTLRGILVIEKKTYIGFVSGGKYDDSWKVSLKKKSYTLKNPLHQNFGHTQALGEYLQNAELPILSVILFGNNAKLGKYLPENVVNDRDFNRYYKALPNSMSREQVETVSRKILALEGLQAEYKREHLEKIKSYRK